MFGRRDDVIKQDQQRDAKILLPESAMSALVEPSDDNSATDSPATPTPTPPLYTTSVDGFSAPTGNLTNPMNYTPRPAQVPTSPAPPAPEPADTSAQDQPEPAMEPIELSNEGVEHAGYLDHLSDNSPAEELQPAPEPQPEPDSQPMDEPAQPTNEATSNVEDPTPPEEAGAPATSANNSTPSDLLSIKQEALQELSPLVGKLNLDAEEKFRTLMMLIQASDNQALLSEAHAAARAIPDEKKRAQALLDVVNEINYFTNNKSEEK